MSAINKSTLFISGKLFWAKVVGEPHPNFGGDGREWTFEVQPNEKGIQTLLKAGLADRIKGKGYNIGTKGQHKDRDPFIQLKKSEFTKDGNKNMPIRLYDGDDNEWDRNVFIGNESEADVKIDVRDYGPAKKKGVYPSAIRVTNLVEFKSTEFGAMDEEEDVVAPKAPKGKKVVLEDDFLNDDPF